ncbi:MAG: CBS domain-containing protein [Elusimicrobia bacterium]|nr:CBS domain-containing protein [Elusimicrobiota bacterium]
MKDLRSVRVEEIMTSPVVTVPAGATLREAARIVDERRISCLVVEEDGAPAGILTERDLVRSLSRGVGPDESVGSFIGESLVSVDADALEQRLDEGLPDGEMDGERIGAVIDNLLSNAVKFSRKGDSITISAGALPEGGVRVEVADTGVGIDEGDMPKLFTEFAKLRSKPTANEASTGLGLAIVKKTVEQHGGSVYARSEKGKGSTSDKKLRQPSASQSR